MLPGIASRWQQQQGKESTGYSMDWKEKEHHVSNKRDRESEAVCLCVCVYDNDLREYFWCGGTDSSMGGNTDHQLGRGEDE